jgi:hypothetical protein
MIQLLASIRGYGVVLRRLLDVMVAPHEFLLDLQPDNHHIVKMCTFYFPAVSPIKPA